MKVIRRGLEDRVVTPRARDHCSAEGPSTSFGAG